MLKNITFILLFQSMLFSAALEVEVYEFRFHGNFCGANLPLINKKSKDDEIQILKNIVPVDLIDQACKTHDICYLHTSTKKSVCDQRLVLELKSFNNKLEDRSCRRLNKSIRYFFTMKTDNPLSVIKSDNSLKEKMYLMPSVTLSNMVDSASMASIVAVNYIYRKPAAYLFNSDKNKERRKEVLQIFPKRFTVCSLKNKNK